MPRLYQKLFLSALIILLGTHVWAQDEADDQFEFLKGSIELDENGGGEITAEGYDSIKFEQGAFPAQFDNLFTQALEKHPLDFGEVGMVLMNLDVTLVEPTENSSSEPMNLSIEVTIGQPKAATTEQDTPAGASPDIASIFSLGAINMSSLVLQNVIDAVTGETAEIENISTIEFSFNAPNSSRKQ